MWRPSLTALDFGSTMIARCFQPSLGRILPGRALSTSSRMLDFVIRMLAEARSQSRRRGWARSDGSWRRAGRARPLPARRHRGYRIHPMARGRRAAEAILTALP